MGFRGRGKGSGSPNTFAVDCDEDGTIFDPTTGDVLGNIAEIERERGKLPALEHKETNRNTPTDPGSADDPASTETLIVDGNAPTETEEYKRAFSNATVYSCDNFLDALNTEVDQQDEEHSEVEEQPRLRSGLTLLFGGLLSIIASFAVVTGRVHRNIVH